MKNRIDFLLSEIKNKIDELTSYEDPELEILSPEELIILATNLVTYGNITQEYTHPVAIVDRTQVQFVIDKKMVLNIGDQEDETSD